MQDFTKSLLKAWFGTRVAACMVWAACRPHRGISALIASTSVPRAFEAEWGSHQGCLQPSAVEKAWERSSATVAMLVVLAEEKYSPGVGCLQPTCLEKYEVQWATGSHTGLPQPREPQDMSERLCS